MIVISPDLLLPEIAGEFKTAIFPILAFQKRAKKTPKKIIQQKLKKAFMNTEVGEK